MSRSTSAPALRQGPRLPTGIGTCPIGRAVITWTVDASFPAKVVHSARNGYACVRHQHDRERPEQH
jgi:hypothetical protein